MIVAGIMGAFVIALWYGAMQRSQNVLPVESGQGSVYDLSGGSDTRLEFLDDKPDAMAGVRFDEDPVPVAAAEPEPETPDNGMSARLAQWMENQELNRLQQDSERRTRLEQRRLDELEAAIGASSRVEGVGNVEGRREGASRADPDNASWGIERQPEPDFIVPAASREEPTLGQVPAQPNSLAEYLASPAGQTVIEQLGYAAPSTSGSTETAAVRRGASFVDAAANDRDYVLEERVRAPRSPYEIKTGTIIPGAMISAANSDLPGDIVAQVTRNVYDTATGRFLLIPQGTKLVGRYDAYTALGQERLLIVWNRLIFPDGETLDIGGMQGYDDRGLAGFKDRVNTHFVRTLLNAFLLSAVNASGDALVNSLVDSDGDGTSITLNLAQDFTDTTSAAFSDYLRNRLRIKPTLEIRAGYRFNIIVSEDIDFDRPYERGFKTYSRR